MSGSAAGPRRRARKVAIAAAAVAAALALVVAIAPAFLGAPWMRETILRWLNRSPDRQVGFADLSVSWKDGIRLDGVTVTDLRTGTQRPFLSADEVAIDVAWRPLLQKRIVASAFSVRGVVFDATQPSAERREGETPPRLPEGAFGLASARVPVTIEDALVKLAKGEVRVREARLLVTVEDDVLVVDPIDAEVNGGRVTGSARIELGGERPAHRMDLHATDVVLDDALAPLAARVLPLLAGKRGEARTQGKAGLDVAIEARGRTLEELTASLRGEGAGAFEDVVLSARTWLTQALALAGRDAERLALEPARIPFRVGERLVTIEESEVRSNVVHARVGGVVGLDGSLDAVVRVRPAGRSERFERLARWLDPEGFVPLRLTGAVNAPSIRLPGAPDLLENALRQSGVGDRLRSAIDQALRR